MKRVLTILILAICFSCGGDGDDPVPTHEVGNWELDFFATINVPLEYQLSEGEIYDLSILSFDGVSLESYELNLNSDLTYTRSLGVQGPNINDNGTWILEDDELILTDEDENDFTFEIQRNEEDQLWLSEEINFGLVKDAIRDTITAEWISTLSNAELNALIDPVILDLVYAFERE